MKIDFVFILKVDNFQQDIGQYDLLSIHSLNNNLFEFTFPVNFYKIIQTSSLNKFIDPFNRCIHLI